jgi:hypothetical protein
MASMEESGAVFEELRAVALGATAVLPQPPWEHPDVRGLVADIPMHGGFASIVALTDGTASIYLSNGGALLGAGELPGVADAVHRVLIATQDELDVFADAGPDGTLPPPGMVRLHLLAPEGGRAVDLDESLFWVDGSHRLSPVAAAIRALVELIDPVPS